MASSINASTSGAGGVITTADNTGILNLQTGGTTAVTIDTSQNVGIGITSPDYRLVIQDATAATRLRIVNNNNGVAGCGVFMQVYNGASVVSDCTITSDNAGNCKFFTGTTSGSERMRITSGGNIWMGTTSASRSNRERLEVYTTSGEGVLARVSDLSYSAFVTKSLDAGAGTHFIGYWEKSDGTNVGKITHDNSTTSYTTTSDYRLKENVQPMTGALEKVSMLKPVTFKWIDSQKDGQGFIAHELQEVVPDCVVGEKDAMREDGKIEPQSIDTSFLVATLTAAIQEQQTIINDLKARIETLEAK